MESKIEKALEIAVDWEIYRSFFFSCLPEMATAIDIAEEAWADEVIKYTSKLAYKATQHLQLERRRINAQKETTS